MGFSADLQKNELIVDFSLLGAGMADIFMVMDHGGESNDCVVWKKSIWQLFRLIRMQWKHFLNIYSCMSLCFVLLCSYTTKMLVGVEFSMWLCWSSLCTFYVLQINGEDSMHEHFLFLSGYGEKDVEWHRMLPSRPIIVVVFSVPTMCHDISRGVHIRTA